MIGDHSGKWLEIRSYKEPGVVRTYEDQDTRYVGQENTRRYPETREPSSLIKIVDISLIVGYYAPAPTISK